MSISDLLQNKNIAVAVTGSIAAYKTVELVRLLIKSGANVKVVMSESAEKFVTPLTFEAISGHLVLTDKNESWATENDSRSHNHIGLAKWAELFIVAPASANTIAKIANGIADNLLTQSLLAHNGIKILAPSANTAMLDHPITKANLKMLSLCNYKIIEPVCKLLACGDTGKGAMAEVDDIFWESVRALLGEDYYTHRNVIISGGGSKEKIDDVRYIGNFSSGKMAASLALAMHSKGADVTLVTSKLDDTLPSQIKQVLVVSAHDFCTTINEELEKSKKPKTTKPSLMNTAQVVSISKEPILIMAAAIADYKPDTQVQGKIKKESTGATMQLNLVQTEDVLLRLTKDGVKTIGFKAEFDDSIAHENAGKMLEGKSLSAVCLNILDKNSFGSDENEVFFISTSKTEIISKSDKLSVSFRIGDLIKTL